MNIRRFILRAGLVPAALLLFSASLMAETPYDPSSGSASDYPPLSPVEKKGRGKAVMFDDAPPPAPETASEGAFDPNRGTVRGYPSRPKKDPRGNAVPLELNDGSVQYPANYLDPADKKPMVVPEDEEDEVSPKKRKEIVLPEEVCPLWHDRAKFVRANRRARKKSLVGLAMGNPYVTIQTRERDWKPPVRVTGGIRLEKVFLDEKRKEWAAKVRISDDYLCGDALHTVYRDDSLSDSASVLDIRPNFVLLLVDGQPAYLRPENLPPVEWRMVWDTGIEMEYETGKTRSELADSLRKHMTDTKKGKAAKKRSKKKPKRRRRPKRKK